jgi:hypothetical protein
VRERGFSLPAWFTFFLIINNLSLSAATKAPVDNTTVSSNYNPVTNGFLVTIKTVDLVLTCENHSSVAKLQFQPLSQV